MRYVSNAALTATGMNPIILSQTGGLSVSRAVSVCIGGSQARRAEEAMSPTKVLISVLTVNSAE